MLFSIDQKLYQIFCILILILRALLVPLDINWWYKGTLTFVDVMFLVFYNIFYHGNDITKYYYCYFS